jgi:hypothetical protein
MLMSNKDCHILKYVFREFPQPPFLVNETYTKITYKDVEEMVKTVFKDFPPFVEVLGNGRYQINGGEFPIYTGKGGAIEALKALRETFKQELFKPEEEPLDNVCIIRTDTEVHWVTKCANKDDTIVVLTANKESAKKFLLLNGSPNPDCNFEEELLDTMVDYANSIIKDNGK